MISGCTALFTLIYKNEVFVANAGDSKCILVRKSHKDGYIQINSEHKPTDKIEKERIKKAGGKIIDG